MFKTKCFIFNILIFNPIVHHKIYFAKFWEINILCFYQPCIARKIKWGGVCWGVI